MVKNQENQSDQEQQAAKYICFYKDGRLMGTAPHICRGFECQQEGKVNRSESIDKE